MGLRDNDIIVAWATSRERGWKQARRQPQLFEEGFFDGVGAHLGRTATDLWVAQCLAESAVAAWQTENDSCGLHNL